MTDFEQKTQTSTQFDDGFFSYRPIQPSQDKIITPNFAPFSFTAEMPESETPEANYSFSPASQDSEPAFEYEKQYSFDTSSYGEEEIVAKTMAMPTFQRQQEEEIVASYQNQTVKAPKLKLNARGKIAVSVYSIVVAIIIAFCIYNAVAIGGLTTDVVSKESYVATQTEIINTLQNTYNSLGEDDTIISATTGEFKTPTAEDTVTISGFEMVERPTEKEQTSWFENFCEALRKLFS